MVAFAIVTGDENFAFGNNDVGFSGSVDFGTIGVRMASGFIWVEAVGVFVVEYCDNAVFDANTFAWIGDDAFDDVLVFDASGGFAVHSVAVASVGENDDLPTFW